MSSFSKHLELFGAATMFLTRLPVPSRPSQPPDQLARAARYFPFVGVIVGLISGAVWMLAAGLFPSTVAAGLAIAAGVLVTGALHEDGWADCCDGLGGGATPEKALEIMRDSRIGAYGAIGLVLSIGLRWAALAAMDPWSGFAALLVAHALGRTMIVVALGTLDYAREGGAATGVAGGVASDEMGLTCFFAALIACLLAGWSGVYALCAAAIAGAVMIAWLKRRLGGYTGDGLGAVEQVSEVAALATLAGVLS